MQEDKLYHYAVIRLVPRIEREEFFNVGLIVFCKRDCYIRFEYHLCPEKFRLMHSEAAYEDVIENLETHKQIAQGNPKCGPHCATGYSRTLTLIASSAWALPIKLT